MLTEREATEQIISTLDAMLLGQSFFSPLPYEQFPESWQFCAEKLNTFCSLYHEAQAFAAAIAGGDLDADTPSRRNYLAASLKEIHSQLTSFYLSMDQLVQGKMVSKLYHNGKLFQQYNAMVDKVSALLSSTEGTAESWGDAVTSWRYHQFLSAINHLHIMIIEVDSAGNVVFSNPSAREAFPELKQMPYGQPSSDILLNYLCTFSPCESAPEYPGAAEGAFPVFCELHDTASGAWYKVITDRVKLADGSMGLLHMIDDISEWKHNEQRLKARAAIDPLTGAYTREAGVRRMEELIRLRNEKVNCVAFIDLDDLKHINDRYGHTEGDYAIKTVVEVIRSSIRDSDWVVRYGGDEFLVLFANCPEPVAQKILTRMAQKLDEINESGIKPFRLSFSAGLSAILPDMAQAADVITVVDQRMYAVKAAK